MNNPRLVSFKYGVAIVLPPRTAKIPRRGPTHEHAHVELSELTSMVKNLAF